MARGNTNSRKGREPPPPRQPPTHQTDQPPPEPGRVRTLKEARQALRIPATAAADSLKRWGVPADFQLVVYPVSDSDLPNLLAEFAVLRVVIRRGRQLTPRLRASALSPADVANGLWVVYGSIVETANTTLVIDTLSVGPAYNDQLSRKGKHDRRGISSELLRLLSPPKLLSACVERLQRDGYWLDEIERSGGPAISDKQRQWLARLEQARPRHAPASDDQLADIAKRYIVLYQQGLRHPLPQLAQEFGITRSQARDRIHKARTHGYLTPGKQGRAGATVGPRLKQLGWKPPTRLTGSRSR